MVLPIIDFCREGISSTSLVLYLIEITTKYEYQKLKSNRFFLFGWPKIKGAKLVQGGRKVEGPKIKGANIKGNKYAF